MTSNELRLMNWVNYPNWNKSGEDAHFMCRELYLCDDRIGLSNGVIQTQTTLSTIKPIPLTEEWLIKAGFEDNDFRGSLFINVLLLGKITAYDVDSESLRIELGTIGGYRFGYPKIKYVHQLQNIYFALCGEELKFD